MRIAILLLPALFLTACASVDTTPSASLIAGTPGELTSSEGLRAKARFRVDTPFWKNCILPTAPRLLYMQSAKVWQNQQNSFV